jgi:hypothetical protein
MSKFMDDFRRGYGSGYQKGYMKTAKKGQDARIRYESLWLRFWKWVLGK